MRIHPFLYGLLVFGVFLVTIGAFQANGIWSVSGKLSASGEAVQPSVEDVSTIKGWMTLQQVSDAYHLPVDQILREYDLPADTSPTTALKELETDQFSLTNLRSWLQTQAGDIRGH